MIEIVEVTRPDCQKCEHTWRVLGRLMERNSNLRIYKVIAGQIGRSILMKYNIQYVPFLMIYLDGELLAVHKFGFTENMIKFAIEKAIGFDLK